MIRRMQATRILAVRHGETAWNVDGRIQGHLDIALSDVGRAQARRLGRALAEREPLALIVSSDLARASRRSYLDCLLPIVGSVWFMRSRSVPATPSASRRSTRERHGPAGSAATRCRRAQAVR